MSWSEPMKVVFQSEILDVPRKVVAVDEWTPYLAVPGILFEASGIRDLSAFRASSDYLGYKFTLQNTFYCLPGRVEHVYIANFGLCFSLPDLGFDILPEGQDGPFQKILNQLLSSTPKFSKILRHLHDAALQEYDRATQKTSRLEQALAEKMRRFSGEQLDCSNEMHLEERLVLWRWLTTRRTYVWFLEKRPKHWIRGQPDYYDEIAYSRELSLLYFLRLYGTYVGQILVGEEGRTFKRSPDLDEANPLWRRAGPRIHALAEIPWEHQEGDESVRLATTTAEETEAAEGVIRERKRDRIGRFGRYQAIERFGGGAMAEVYHGTDPVIGREVAIKAMSREAVEPGNEKAWWERFHQEAKLVGSLNHPNIVTLYDFGEQDGRPFIVMQFLEGQNLKSVIAGKESIPLPRKVDMLSQVASALDYAHERGVIHRDLKPANIMILSGQRAVLTDFGIAALRGQSEERNGRLVGTVAYMAPEQIQYQTLDARTDTFALGVTAFELFYGRHPFPGPDEVSTIHRILEADPDFEAVRNPELLPGLEGILRTAMAKDPAERYSRAGHFAEALRTALAELEARETGKVIPLEGEASGASE